MWALLGMMFLIMFGLKIAGIATISWVVVTAPLWAPVVVVALLYVCATMYFKSK